MTVSQGALQAIENAQLFSGVWWIRLTNWLVVAGVIYVIYWWMSKHDE